MNALTLRDTQRVEWQRLVDLETGGFVTATLGSKTEVKLADMTGVSHVVRIRLDRRGRDRCVDNGPNQVICTLGGRPNHSARVRDCKAEGMADDDLLLRMAAARLIEARLESGAGLPIVGVFKRLPRDLVLRLTLSGRAYFPHDMVGASA